MALDISVRRDSLQLFDAYGELLTAHQREALRLHLAEDWSYAEIATAQGVSRAAIYDMVHRGQLALRAYEGKLGVLAADQLRDHERAALKGRVDELEDELRSLRRVAGGIS